MTGLSMTRASLLPENFLLETKCLNLVPFSLADSDQLHRLWNEPDVRKYLWDDKAVSMETVVEVIESSILGFADRGFGFCTVRLKDSDADPPNQASFRLLERLGMHFPPARLIGILEALYYTHRDEFPANALFFSFGHLLSPDHLPES